MTEATQDQDQAPEGAAAVAAVAEQGENASSEVRVNALAYLMGEEPPPNTGQAGRFPLDVDFGSYGDPRLATITFKALTSDELDRADQMASEVDPVTKRDRGINVFKRSCIIMAMAQVDPPLGPIVERRNAEGGAKRVADASHLLMDLFARSAGVPLRVENHIRRRSRMDFDDDQTVREIEAGKA
jgi:hypothetical protein